MGGERLYAPSTVTWIKVLAKETKMLIHKCRLACCPAGNWAAREFEAGAGLLSLRMSQQFLKISEFQESSLTSSEPLPPSCIRNTGGLCISGMQKTGTVRSVIQPRWCVGTWLKLIKRSLRQTEKKKGFVRLLKEPINYYLWLHTPAGPQHGIFSALTTHLRAFLQSQRKPICRSAFRSSGPSSLHWSWVGLYWDQQNGIVYTHRFMLGLNGRHRSKKSWLTDKKAWATAEQWQPSFCAWAGKGRTSSAGG